MGEGEAFMKYGSISNHLCVRPWQLAVAQDKTLPVRKWYHLGEVYAVSSMSAVCSIGKSILKAVEPVDEESVVFQCSDGSFVRVH